MRGGRLQPRQWILSSCQKYEVQLGFLRMNPLAPAGEMRPALASASCERRPLRCKLAEKPPR